mmetsp:Transcript_27635/g.50317  ORF Transcript_27635/g.50317 Transcript_27635/m.50317 type:complete len:201 (-) Transcript_27635:75-677(-)
MAIRKRLKTKACFLPYLSPIYPITKPPTGLIRNAPPYTAKLLTKLDVSISPPISTKSSLPFPLFPLPFPFSLALSSSSDGAKNTVAIISLKKPNKAKSYHSSTLPITPAMVCMAPCSSTPVAMGGDDGEASASSSSSFSRCSLLVLLDAMVTEREREREIERGRNTWIVLLGLLLPTFLGPRLECLNLAARLECWFHWTH